MYKRSDRSIRFGYREKPEWLVSALIVMDCLTDRKVSASVKLSITNYSLKWRPWQFFCNKFVASLVLVTIWQFGLVRKSVQIFSSFSCICSRKNIQLLCYLHFFLCISKAEKSTVRKEASDLCFTKFNQKYCGIDFANILLFEKKQSNILLSKWFKTLFVFIHKKSASLHSRPIIMHAMEKWLSKWFRISGRYDKYYASSQLCLHNKELLFSPITFCHCILKSTKMEET